MNKLHLKIALGITLIHCLSVGYASNLDNQDDQSSSSDPKIVRSQAIPPVSTLRAEKDDDLQLLLSLNKPTIFSSTSTEKEKESILNRPTSSSSSSSSNSGAPLLEEVRKNTWNNLYKQVENLLVNNDLKGAIELLDYWANIAMVTEINKAEILNVRGIAKFRDGDHLGAISDLSKVLSVPGIRDNIRSQAFYARGKAQGRLGRHDKAIEDFKECYKLKDYSSRGLAFEMELRLNFLYF